MSGITDPTELYFKNGTWVWDGSEWVEAVCDPDGAMSVSIHNQDVNVEIEQTDPASLAVGLHGWDGANWQKLNLLFGYYERWLENLGGTQSGNGNYSANTTPVPQGYVYVLQGVSIRNLSGSRGETRILLTDGSVPFIALVNMTPTQFVSDVVIGNFVLCEGDYVNIFVYGCSDGDVIQAAAWGYKMKIT